MTIAGVVLAAGSSERLGRPKQLLMCEGEPLVRVIARRVRAATDATCVVLGASKGDIRPTLAGLEVDVVECADWREGMAASLRAAVAWATPAGHEALVVCACDQPGLDSEHVARLVAIYRGRNNIVVASGYEDTAGVPALFPRRWFDRLSALAGDQGARNLLGDALVVDWPPGAFDIDTPEIAAEFLSQQ